ncbi:MAG: hypothetical protein AAB723_01085 [Patescibacteria group bacterium]
MLPPILTRRISSFLALSIIIFLALVVAIITIDKSSKFKALQAEQPLWLKMAVASETNE